LHPSLCPIAPFLHCAACHPALHSFPTRRSSDLLERDVAADGGLAIGELQPLRSEEGTHLRSSPRYAAITPGCCCTCVGVPSNRRSEEHTSELQSLTNLVCRLLLEKKKYDEQLTH